MSDVKFLYFPRMMKATYQYEGGRIYPIVEANNSATFWINQGCIEVPKNEVKEYWTHPKDGESKLVKLEVKENKAPRKDVEPPKEADAPKEDDAPSEDSMECEEFDVDLGSDELEEIDKPQSNKKNGKKR